MTISDAVVLDVFRGTMWMVVAGRDWSGWVTGSCICQIVGGPAAQVAQNTACSSQLAYARCGDDGSAARRAADS